MAIVAIAALTYGDSWLAYASKRWEALLEGTPSIVVRDGRFDRDGMRSERMTENDVLGHVRAKGIHDMRDVHLAVVEHDGSVSVLKREEGDTREPPPEFRTDSPKALGLA